MAATYTRSVFGAQSGLGQQFIVQRSGLGAVGDAASYSLWGALAGTAMLGVILMVKYPKVPRGVGFAGLLPLGGVLAGQLLATRKV